MGTADIFYIPDMMHAPGNPLNKLTMYLEDTTTLNIVHIARKVYKCKKYAGGDDSQDLYYFLFLIILNTLHSW